jgi:hypothetical protein
MDALISSAGRIARQRTTLYAQPLPGQVEASYNAGLLQDVVNTPVEKKPRELRQGGELVRRDSGPLIASA